MIIPEFSENTEKAMLLYFSAAGADEKELESEIEKSYFCFSKMQRTVKNGKPYLVIEIPPEKTGL